MQLFCVSALAGSCRGGATSEEACFVSSDLSTLECHEKIVLGLPEGRRVWGKKTSYAGIERFGYLHNLSYDVTYFLHYFILFCSLKKERVRMRGREKEEERVSVLLSGLNPKRLKCQTGLGQSQKL